LKTERLKLNRRTEAINRALKSPTICVQAAHQKTPGPNKTSTGEKGKRNQPG